MIEINLEVAKAGLDISYEKMLYALQNAKVHKVSDELNRTFFIKDKTEGAFEQIAILMSLKSLPSYASESSMHRCLKLRV